jgi:hypothetical protein
MASNNSKYSEEMRERTARYVIENGKSAKRRSIKADRTILNRILKGIRHAADMSDAF